MPPQVRFISHACIALEGEKETLLADPWLFGDVFNNSWTLHAPPDLNTIDFGRWRHIWLSHEHPDHMHIPSLRFIRERVAGTVTLYYRRQKDPAVRDRLAALGFKVVELLPHETLVIADDIAVTLFPTGIDSALVVRLGDRIIVNQNDCSLDEEEIRSLTAMFPRIDAWFFQFSLGGYNANEDDSKGLRAAQEFHLELVRRYFAALSPGLFVPFASFFYFSKEANAFLNDWCITPAEFVDRFPDLPVQILWSGEALRWEDGQARNAVNLARWTEVLRGPRVIKPPEPSPENELLAAGSSFVQHAFACRLILDGEMHLEIKETGRAAVIDWDNGTFTISDKADPARLVLTAPAEELLYFFTSPNGDSIYFGSCLRVARSKGLYDLLALRRKLRGLHPSRILMLKWHVAQLDRNYLGGTVKSLYRRVRSHL